MLASLIAIMVLGADLKADANALLDRAAASPHNGMNPKVEVDAQTLARLSPELERVVREGPCQRRRDAASLVKRLPAKEKHAFWAEQLQHKDLSVRFLAIAMLGDVADPRDFERVARQAIAAPAMGHVLSVRLRDWKDRRAVPVLAELLEGPHSSNAALSLSQLPDVPQLPPDKGPAEHHPSGAWIQKTDAVAPYKRWWAEQGARAFKAEATWWAEQKKRTKPEEGLVSEEPCKP